MTEPWDIAGRGVVRLPSGRLVRGRGLRDGLPDGQRPTLAVHLTAHPGGEPPWERRWIEWRDFWLPADPDAGLRTLRHAFDRAIGERVEMACGGGVGRTGTAVAVWCVWEGMAPTAAIRWTRRHYHRRAVEVPWQRWFVRRAQQRVR